MPEATDSNWRVELFGSFRVAVSDREVRLKTAKQRGLLAYLIVNAPEPQPRSQLASLLWGSRFEAQARLSLRQALSGLRRQLGDHVVVADTEAVAVCRETLHCDVLEFLTFSEERSTEDLISATRLFGEFLRGLSIEEEGFTEWQRRMQQRFTTIQVECLQKIGECHLRAGEGAEAVKDFERAICLDEFREDLHYLLMKALAASGRRTNALRHAQSLAEILQRELGIGLSPATVELVSQLRGSAISTGETTDSSDGLAKSVVRNKRAIRHQRTHTAAAMDTGRRRILVDSRTSGEELRKDASIVILPFRWQQGEDPAISWFADGLTEDITTNLSGFRDFFVIARTSAYVLGETAAPPIDSARAVGVRYVLIGSVRNDHKRMRITVRLVDAEQERTIWGEQYNRRVDDFFELQEEITRIVTCATAVKIEASERERSRQLPPSDLTAYALVLQGQQHIFRYTREDNWQARMLYDRALNVDPRYARAMAAKSRTLNIDWRYRWTDLHGTALDAALDLTLAAIELDPFDARSFGELGFAHLYRKKHDAAISAYRRALSLNPNDADLMSDMADALQHAGRCDEALPLIQKGMRLNPFYPDQYLWHLGDIYYKLERYGEAIQTIESMQNPTEGYRLLAASYAHLGRLAEARFYAAKVLQAHPDFSLDAWAAVIPNKDESEQARFVADLRKAGL